MVTYCIRYKKGAHCHTMGWQLVAPITFIIAQIAKKVNRKERK